MRYKLTLAYDGTDFHGWQRQEPPDAEPLRTVQGVLEEAVRAVVREPVDVVGASRTDTGVHARGQVAAFSTTARLPLSRLPLAINSRLPDDVQIRRVDVVVDEFNPIADCTSKGYRYRLMHGCARGGLPPLFGRRYMTHTAYTLDIAAMSAAAAHLMGEHDFASFTRENHDRESTVRRIIDCSLDEPAARHITLEISGTGFLHNMIRIIAGTLVEVGRGKLAADDMSGIIAARDRRAAGPTLSPEGLFLEWISYGD